MSKSYINGADYFQLYLDKENKRRGAAENAVRLLLILEKNTDLNALKVKFEQADILSQINGLKLKSSKLNNHYYWQEGPPVKTNVTITKWSDKLDSIFPFNSLEEGNWLKIDLLEGVNKNAILFHVHHLITDNKGLQDLIGQLNTDPDVKVGSVPEMQKCGTAKSFFQKTWKMLQPKSGKMLQFSAKNKKYSKIKYYTLSKNIREIHAINQVLSGVVLPGSSTVFLNHIASELKTWAGINDAGYYFWVPVPANRRKRNIDNAFHLGNQLSILFYKIDLSLNDKERLTELQTQIINQVRNRTVVDYEQLTNTMTKFPYPLYKAMLELPDRGNFCSFTYSDLGHTFKNQNEIFGQKILDAINFPSVPLAPGIVFVTMAFEDKFHLVLGVDDNILPEQTAKQILDNLQKRFVE